LYPEICERRKSVGEILIAAIKGHGIDLAISEKERG